ncbi:hypothetical protein K458DRAFT_404599 [Lentithecium fluviatile CBS 122367]|uniref:Uncharacterized protein n=1 Tax=Lentithecium fluviatile CBS 122367 TaxID=1168545 RepID=A0A6G1IZG6_9PLEO|nr:hypothetical protein K458DRAFT_404599 [Lentithecium fluviatile CBS 122367]
MEPMATDSWTKHSIRTPEHKKSISDWLDSAYDTTAQPQLLSLTGEMDEHDLDGEFELADQNFTYKIDGKHPDMESEVKDSETCLLTVGNPDPNVEAPPPSQNTSPTDSAPVKNPPATPKRKQTLILKLPKRVPSSARDTLTTEAPATTKSGRRVKARKVQDDTLVGDDYEAYMGNLKRGGAARQDDEEYEPSSPPVVPPKRGPVRSSNPSYHAPPMPVEEILTSETIAEDRDDFAAALSQELTNSAVGDTEPTTHPFCAQIDEEIHQIVHELATQQPVPINLPTPSTGPWTGGNLIHMYISAYTSQCWHICDLIADTWIRAFQDINKSSRPIWRANKGGWVYQAKDAENFGLDAVDPALDPQVCAFEAKVLNNLYYYTEKNCGARMLWADAMALCGAEWEDELTGKGRRGEKWHSDIFYNVMCTSLRMVRRKLTLKIEESTEGAWCKRYHMHALKSLPCYRVIAHAEAMSACSADDTEDEQLEQRPQKRKRVAWAEGGDQPGIISEKD